MSPTKKLLLCAASALLPVAVACADPLPPPDEPYDDLSGAWNGELEGSNDQVWGLTGKVAEGRNPDVTLRLDVCRSLEPDEYTGTHESKSGTLKLEGNIPMRISSCTEVPSHGYAMLAVTAEKD